MGKRGRRGSLPAKNSRQNQMQFLDLDPDVVEICILSILHSKMFEPSTLRALLFTCKAMYTFRPAEFFELYIVRNVWWPRFGDDRIFSPGGLTAREWVTMLARMSSEHRKTLLRFTDATTTVAPKAFLGCTALCLRELPSGITKIGDRAFEGCANLELASLPEGVTKIGIRAFAGCKKLALRSLPATMNVRDFGIGAFFMCGEMHLRGNDLVTLKNLTYRRNGDGAWHDGGGPSSRFMRGHWNHGQPPMPNNTNDESDSDSSDGGFDSDAERVF